MPPWENIAIAVIFGVPVIAYTLWQIVAPEEVDAEKERLETELQVERMLRQGEKLLRNGAVNGAWRRLEPLPQGKVRPDEMAELRILRGCALKRLGRLSEARLEVDESLRAKPTISGLYNKACYMALEIAAGSAADTLEDVREVLETAVELAEKTGGIEAVSESLREDTRSPKSDLYELRDADVVRRVLRPIQVA